MVDGFFGLVLEDVWWVVEEGNRYGIGYVIVYIFSMVVMIVWGVMLIIEIVILIYV